MAQCPLCRMEFMIPWNGLSSLKVNFSLQKLVETKRASTSDTCNKGTYSFAYF